MNDQRLTDRLMGYWDLIRKEAPIPDFNHFSASSIDDVWQQCLLFAVSPVPSVKPFVFNFQQVGDKIRPLYGQDMVGRSFNTAQRHFQGAAIVRRMEEMILNPAALTDIGQFINERSKIVKYRACMLPFGRDDKVTHVVVGLSWREF